MAHSGANRIGREIPILFAGIENELFYDAKTSMLFGDAKASLGKLVTEMKNV
jgi:NAD/NADP transhydrogenase beta subunit